MTLAGETRPMPLGEFPITITEEQLAALEEQVRRGLAGYVKVGMALMEIRDRGGYRLRGYATFGAYCRGEFGSSDRHARRLMTAASTATRAALVLGEAPRNEGAARELEKVADDPAALRQVAGVLASGKGLRQARARDVAAAVATVTGTVAPAPATPPPPRAARDVCPACRVVPESYVRGHTRPGGLGQGTGWQCGACGAPVALRVRARRSKTGPTGPDPA